MMTRRTLWLVLATVALVSGMGLLSRRQRHPAAGPQRADPAAAPRAAGTAPGEPDAAKVAALVKLSETLARTREPVGLRAAQVVATVNGAPITGKDLLPFSAAQGGAVQSMSPQMYWHLLNRAIERELAFQAARRRGVQLDEAQRRELAQVRRAAEQRSGVDRAALDFEARDAEGQLLLRALAAESGVPSPYATEADVERYYEAHRAGLGDLPSDPSRRGAEWQRIQLEIRRVLAGEMRVAHNQGLRRYIDQLKTSAAITI
jgi:hypothetical protein